MRSETFWSGFAAGTVVGALAGVGGVLAARRRASEADRRVVRLEKSINIGSPVQRVFAAWSDLEQLPRWISFIRRVEHRGPRWHWLVNLNDREFQWDSQITQVIPGESIGWKSLRGPRHTGRITFSPAGEQTVVHVIMNYAPPMGRVGAMMPMEEHLERWIERGLREFKAAMEQEQHQAALRTGAENTETRATGTTGEDMPWRAET